VRLPRADIDTGVDLPPAPAAPLPGVSPGRRALRRLMADRWAMLGLAVVAVFAAIAGGVWLGLWGQDWMATGAGQWQGPSPAHWLGTTILGQDILQRALYSTRTAFEIGLIVALASTALGGLLGALSGYFVAGPIDGLILWLKGVLDAIPFYLFVAALAFALDGNPWAMHIAMVATFWTTTARLVRGEVIKLRELEFVEAARAIGLGAGRIIFRHIVPNTLPILLVQATITFVAAIKSEVILSFLGLGVQNSVSWGLMIAESTTEVLAGHYMNFIAASSFLFMLVMGFNLFADGLQDALDPKTGIHK